MDVFIGNLSQRTTLSDLVAFFKSFASDARFQLFDKHYQDGSSSRYAVATIDPDKLAEKAIKKLNGQSLNGVPVLLREFLHRSYGNERRAMGWRDKVWHGVERRQNERRRKMAVKPSDFDREIEASKHKSFAETVDLDNVQVEARSLFTRKG